MAKKSVHEVETIRRIYYGDLIKLCRWRFGGELPDDDAGRESLFDLLVLASLATVTPWKKMSNAVGLHAPWLNGGGLETIDIVNSMPLSERWHIARTLGVRHRVTYAERERYGLRNISPCDKTKEELAEIRKAKDRSRKKRKRAEAGRRTRPEYRAAVKSKEPWVPLGIKKSAYYKRKAKERLHAE